MLFKLRRCQSWAILLSAALCAIPQHSLARNQAGLPASGTVDISGMKMAYQLAESISGTVNVATSGPLNAPRVVTEVFDPATCQLGGQCIDVFRKSYDVKTDSGNHASISFSLPTLPINAYMLQVMLTTDQQGEDTSLPPTPVTLDTHTVRFGVRQAELANLPDHILKASLSTMKTDTIEQNLTQAAQNSQLLMVQLTPDTSVRVKVSSQPTISTGVQIPGIGKVSNFVGQLVDEQGNPEPGSNVNFLIIDGQLSATISRTPPGQDTSLPSTNFEGILVDPMTDYVSESSRDQHVVYLNRNSVTPNGTPHVDPGPEGVAAIDTGSSNIAAQLKAAISTADVANYAHDYVLPVSVYEHQFAGKTPYRYRIINRAMQQFTYEFLSVSERYDTNHFDTVLNWQLTSWQTIGDAGYSSSCHDNIVGHFVPEHPDPGIISVLFTGWGGDCGGIATRPAGRSGVHAIVVDANLLGPFQGNVNSEDLYTMIAMQEIGHNFDSTSYGSTPSYDGHLDPLISDAWTVFGPQLGCTAMRASYDCTWPTFRFHQTTDEPLHSLTVGIRKFTQEAQEPVLQSMNKAPSAPGLPVNQVKDIAVGADGSVWAIRDDGTIWKKRVNSSGYDPDNIWDQAPGGGERIAVEPNGIPWVVNSDGLIFRKGSADPSKDDYTQMPGQAHDIGAGGSFISPAIWVTGWDAISGGGDYGLFRWKAGNPGSWEQMPNAAAVRVAVDRDQNAWVVNSSRQIFEYEKSSGQWTQVPGQALDIAAGGGSADFKASTVIAVIADETTLADAVAGLGRGYVSSSYQCNPQNLKSMPHFVPQYDPGWPSGHVALQGALGLRMGLAVDPQGYAWEAYADTKTNAPRYYVANAARQTPQSFTCTQ